MSQKELKQMIKTQKEFNQKLRETRKQVAELLAIYQNGTSGYEYEVSIESALKTAFFALEKV